MNSVLVVIVARDRAHLLIRRLKKFAIDDIAIIYGEGTQKSLGLGFLGLNRFDKELIICRIDERIEDEVFAFLSDEIYIRKQNSGVAFTIPFVFPTDLAYLKESESAENNDINEISCLVTIVETGFADECMDVAVREGATGGTVIRGRGAGVPEDFSFPIIIDPDKDIVINILPKADAMRIKASLEREMKLAKPGAGFVFLLSVKRFTGFMQF